MGGLGEIIDNMPLAKILLVLDQLSGKFRHAVSAIAKSQTGFRDIKNGMLQIPHVVDDHLTVLFIHGGDKIGDGDIGR